MTVSAIFTGGYMDDEIIDNRTTLCPPFDATIDPPPSAVAKEEENPQIAAKVEKNPVIIAVIEE